ncbi:MULTISPECIES: DMT family transporter [Bacillus]|uniref:DMT family transporter n=1 Tax=Bacillus TaxID=1386 RepID=UPI0002F9D4B4|nr:MULTISPECIES: DMT family transporter [Bacillus]
MQTEKFFQNPWGMALSAITATFLWGSAFPVIKLSYQSLGIGPADVGEQILFAGYRFFLSALLIFLFYLIIGKKNELRFEKSSVKIIIVLGILMTFLQYFFFYIGLSHATGIQGSIISGTSSFFQIIFAHFLLKDDHLYPAKVIGLLVGFCGVIITYIPKGDVSFTIGYGEWLVLASIVIAAYGNIVTKRALANWRAHYLSGYGMLIGSVLLLLLGMFLTDFTFFTFSIKDLIMLLYLAFLSAAAFLLWNNILKYHQVGKVTLFNFLIPVFGVFLSGIFLNEAIGITAIIGLILVTLGIIFVNAKSIIKIKKEHQN